MHLITLRVDIHTPKPTRLYHELLHNFVNAAIYYTIIRLRYTSNRCTRTHNLANLQAIAEIAVPAQSQRSFIPKYDP